MLHLLLAFLAMALTLAQQPLQIPCGGSVEITSPLVKAIKCPRSGRMTGQVDQFGRPFTSLKAKLCLLRKQILPTVTYTEFCSDTCILRDPIRNDMNPRQGQSYTTIDILVHDQIVKKRRPTVPVPVECVPPTPVGKPTVESIMALQNNVFD